MVKQLVLYKLLKIHNSISQNYLVNMKLKLDKMSSSMPESKQFLEKAYKSIIFHDIKTADMEYN